MPDQDNFVSPPRASSSNRVWLVVILILIAIGVILAVNLFRLQKENEQKNALVALNQTQQSTLAGQVVFTGLEPEAGDAGEIEIVIRPAGSDQEFIDTGIRLPLIGDLSWNYKDVAAGQNYEVRAMLLIEGASIAASTSQIVTAPALHIELDIDVDWADLGMEPTTVTQEIKGLIQINGYIPDRSSIQIMRVVNNQASPWLSLLANDSQIPFVFTETAPEENYSLYAVLLDSKNQNIGSSSQQLLANAGDTQVNFVINSQAAALITPAPVVATPTPAPVSVQSSTLPTPVPTPTPQPVQTAKVSGQVIVNGPLDNNSRLLILAKTPPEKDYQVWQTINDPSNDGQYWSYDQAVVGQVYNIQVALQVNESNVSTATMVIVTAPAANVNFTLNTGLNLGRPETAPIADPCQRDGDHWKTIIKLPAVADAGQYLVQIGSREGYSDRYNKIIAANGNQEIKFTVWGLDKGKTNYLRYAYSACRYCSSTHNFSGWSVTTGFTCE